MDESVGSNTAEATMASMIDVSSPDAVEVTQEVRVPTADDIFALHYEATEVSAAARIYEAERCMEDAIAFVERIKRAQDDLRAHILANLQAVVLPAAAGGHTDADVFEFRGGDTRPDGHGGDLSVLFLLLGGHERERRMELERLGFEPLVTRLARDLRPFGLEHRWDRETNLNTLVVKW